MEFEKLIRERYSCRKLKDTPIEKEKLERILEAGIAAPTGCNYQPYKLWVLTGEENCRVMSELTKYTFGAGTFIVVGADPSKAWTRKYDGLNISTIDASIVATHLRRKHRRYTSNARNPRCGTGFDLGWKLQRAGNEKTLSGNAGL